MPRTVRSLNSSMVDGLLRYARTMNPVCMDLSQAHVPSWKPLNFWVPACQGHEVAPNGISSTA